MNNEKRKQYPEATAGVRAAVLTFVFMLSLAPKAHAEQQCSTASLRGGYGFHAFATIVPAGTPRAIIAVFTFDGRGGYSGTVTLNITAPLVFSFPTLGLYAVNADCTGTLFPNTGGSFDVIVVDGGNEFYQMR